MHTDVSVVRPEWVVVGAGVRILDDTTRRYCDRDCDLFPVALTDQRQVQCVTALFFKIVCQDCVGTITHYSGLINILFLPLSYAL